jgi:hypothetical protein
MWTEVGGINLSRTRPGAKCFRFGPVVQRSEQATHNQKTIFSHLFTRLIALSLLSFLNFDLLTIPQKSAQKIKTVYNRHYQIRHGEKWPLCVFQEFWLSPPTIPKHRLRKQD